jgi:diguanylate cyclase (GGDEF)-like protein
LTKCADGYHVAAAPDLPREWIAALRVPHAVPFEVWRKHVEAQPGRNPAWKVFNGALSGRAPAAIHSWPVGSLDTPLGALLLFYREASGPGDSDPRLAEAGCRMARLALEHNRMYDDLRFQGHHDSLTGLANRLLYEQHLDRSLREAEILGQKVAVLFIDLDRFKQINDAFSHRVGDLLLGEIARRMKARLRPGDTVARIGGDEFTIVMNDIRDAGEAGEIAARVLGAIREPIVIDGRHMQASASIGIAIFPDDGKDPEQLERAADAAMYHAQRNARSRAHGRRTAHRSAPRLFRGLLPGESGSGPEGRGV